MAVLLFVLLFGGVNIAVGGKTPAVLYLDFILPFWLAYKIYFRGWLPNFRDRKLLYLAIACLLAMLISTLFNLLDVNKSLAAIKIYAVGFLFFGIARRSLPSH